ncbi:polysaccharide deacetylase [Fluviicola sp.]|uniref:polysaccharide deacetylase n=1 Tax=Fluviicola sp. TaxID=1917219 RepID=UPI0028202E5E|nr:polysaccharide deacetylase [Fluviicola sp.]MDR0803020.1 polysaccharide deacetylase [Fluviicola sp.]
MKRFFLFGAFIFLLIKTTESQTNITHYQVTTGIGKQASNQFIVLRSFEKNGIPMYLAADPQTLETQVIPAKNMSFQAIKWSDLQKMDANLPYFKALNSASMQAKSLQDAGIAHGYPAEKGITLTVDLCPSTKPLDHSIFTSLISEFAKIEQPVPIGLSISGKFLNTHAADIQWLKKLETAGQIRITWINHTYTHYYNSKTPLQENFLLKPGTDLNYEVLQTEIDMLQNDLTPSVFFRFPGLVSDNSIVDKIISYGLIPTGSDAWLAKGQNSGSGSIVLIHGNGNEPVGVQDFIRLLQTEKEQVLDKQWLLYDLSESIGDEFEK